MARTIVFFITIFMLFFFKASYAENSDNNTKILFHTDVMDYNKTYQDKNYLDKEWVSFPVFAINTGTEISHKSEDSTIVGVGLNAVKISSGKKKNAGRTIYQPSTAIFMPSAFSGKSWKYIGLELGVSSYMTVKKYDPIVYYNPDGSVKKREGKHYDMNRLNSYTFINFMLRIFPESGPHVKFRFGRENFMVTESLLNMGFIYPFLNQKVELVVSFLMPHNYFYTKKDELRTNQRILMYYTYSFGDFSIITDVGFLVKTIHAGTGYVNLKNRFNFGFGVETRF